MAIIFPTTATTGFAAIGGNSVYTTSTGIFSGLSAVHVFTSPGSFTATSAITAAFLIVGGGGGGAGRTFSPTNGGFGCSAGGGGGGGVVTGTYSLSVGTYAVTIGTGGSYVPSSPLGGLGSAGGTSTFTISPSVQIQAAGGGGAGAGGLQQPGNAGCKGGTGGSGGGANGAYILCGGNPANYAVIAGGTSTQSSLNPGIPGIFQYGSTGGASSTGGNPGPYGGMGGSANLQSSISGTAKYYGGGGGYSSVHNQNPSNVLGANGAVGGGGSGSSSPNTGINGPATAGTPGTGGGGGGGSPITCGRGGQPGGPGVVILSYAAVTTIPPFTVGNDTYKFSTVTNRWVLTGYSDSFYVGPQIVENLGNTATNYFDLPSGTSAQRPRNPQGGYIRFNTDINSVEYYSTVTSWTQLPFRP